MRKEITVTIDKEGVLFGEDVWIGHNKIAGLDFVGPITDEKYESLSMAQQLYVRFIEGELNDQQTKGD